MYNTILVPLDGSKRAEAILTHAEELAQRYKARLILLQVVEPSTLLLVEGSFTAPDPKNIGKRTKDAKSYLTNLKAVFRGKDINAETCVAHGPVVETIIKVAHREQADLIALASHGRGGLSRVFYGSIAAGVLHRADRPLLIIRTRRNER
jgi:nucleotide-binding universal stress UspA family protein